MSQETVEIVKAAMDAYSRGDWDTLLKVVAPDFEFDLSRSIAFVRGVYGREELQKPLSEFGGGLVIGRPSRVGAVRRCEEPRARWTSAPLDPRAGAH
jgi:hypothetical protein